MKKIFSFLTATWFMGTLLIFLAIVLGIATFIENDFGTNAARSLVYDSWWFELVFVVLGINLLGNLFNYKMWIWKRLPVMLFHLAFVLIILGAGVTRYYGYEGLMHIREGESSNYILSANNYLSVAVDGPDVEFRDRDRVLFSPVTPKEYSSSVLLKEGKLKIKSTTFIPQAMARAVVQEGGSPSVTMVLSTKSGRIERSLFAGDELDLGQRRIVFEPEENKGEDVVITLKEGQPFFSSTRPVKVMQMQGGQVEELAPDSLYNLQKGVIYACDDLKMVMSEYLPNAAVRPVSVPGENGQGLPSAIRLEIEQNNQVREMFVFGRNDKIGNWTSLQLEDYKIRAQYGARKVELPFSLHLNKFELERYPGSHSPSSFASEVSLVDPRYDLREDRRIFMNNILNYHGYRFFQSSYDTDEKGTILSVNQDFWGTLLTYAGYFLLALGMLVALFVPNTRFRHLINRTETIYKKKKTITLALLVVIGISAFAAEVNPPHPVSIATANAFGRLWVQDNGGRIKPLNSMNSEVVRKLVKHHTFKGLTADQVMLSVMIDPAYWQEVPMITISHDTLKELLQVEGRKASFRQFFTPDGQYKIRPLVESAYRKRPSYRNKLEQNVIKVDEQVNVFYMAQQGSFLKLFPQPVDSHLPWLTPVDELKDGSKGDSLFVRSIMGLYLEALVKNKEQDANEYLQAIANYQGKYGADILPGVMRKKVEVFYNKSTVFMLLSPYFFVLGIILLVFQFITLLHTAWQFKWIMRGGMVLVVAGFAAYCAGLGMRWYISGHAPWSNGYESMLYIGWSTLLAGLIFCKRSPIALSITALFAGIILMVAHLSWMNPEITNLVPVLKSYWLTIHVAVITASYGFLSMGALLGFLNLILAGLKNERNQASLSLTIEELSCVIEMGLTIGLYLLTIGSFLGGVWANESWGRYWGWDPKETWSAITILVYAFVLHMRLIPGLKGFAKFNFAALIGFGSVIMTYLGVNYYLAGMHSYAKGDPVPVPDFVYYTVIVVATVSIYAFYNESRLRKVLTAR
ncbi:cytochrome C biogenesis protein [Marinilabiliaceae bacterium JC017]|nr:cytochrome C biogenesis protein [Marinilabiliaceae bacterium JC017]